MYLFLLFLFPLAYGLFVRPKRLLLAMAACFVAALICAFRAFFMFRTPYAGASAVVYAANVWLNLAVLPLVVCAGSIVFLRGSLCARLAAFLDVALPFYAVYLPVEVLSQRVPLPFFVLFVKPLLYLAFIAVCAAALRKMGDVMAEKPVATFALVLLVTVFSCVPALIETVWYYGSAPTMWGTLAGIYSALALLFGRMMRRYQHQ